MGLRLISVRRRPYLARWTILETPFFSIKLHFIFESDPDPELHDHPWWFVSLVLGGGYWEMFADPFESSRVVVDSAGQAKFSPVKPAKWRGWLSLAFRKAVTPHRVVLQPGGYAVTLLLTGPRTRNWGFLCRDGWKSWETFRAAKSP